MSTCAAVQTCSSAANHADMISTNHISLSTWQTAMFQQVRKCCSEHYKVRDMATCWRLEVSYKFQTGWFHWINLTHYFYTCFFSVLLLLVGRQEGRPEHKKLGVGLLVVTVWPSFACFIAPAVTTSSIILLSFNKIQHGDILVPANPGPPGKWPLKWRGIFFLSYQITNLQVKLLYSGKAWLTHNAHERDII